MVDLDKDRIMLAYLGETLRMMEVELEHQMKVDIRCLQEDHQKITMNLMNGIICLSNHNLDIQVE